MLVDMMVPPFTRAYTPLSVSDGGTTLPEGSQEEEISEARTLLESMALLERVAAAREAKAERLIGALARDGKSATELARELEISRESVEVMLERDEPKPAHERAGVSEESIEKLDPLTPDLSEELS